MKPQAATLPRSRPVTLWVLLGALWLVASLRRPGTLRAPTIWAEDGREFLAAAAGADVNWIYNGQWWLAQRAVAQAIAVVPAQAWPLLTYTTATLGSALCVGPILQHRATETFGPLPVRFGVAVALVMVPGVWETQGNLANLHVYLLSSVLVISVLPAPASSTWRLCELAYLGFAGLTGLVGAFAAPAALVWATRTRQRHVTARACVLLLAGLVNVIVFVSSPRQPAAMPGADFVGEASIKRVFGTLVVGERGLEALWPRGFWSIWVVPATALAGLVTLFAWRDRRGPSLAWVVTGLAWSVAGIIALEPGGIREDALIPYEHGRYFVPAILCCVLVVGRAIGRRAGGSATLIAAGILVLGGFVADARQRAFQPAVSEAAARSFERCRRDGPYPCTLAIAPPGWSIVLRGGG